MDKPQRRSPWIWRARALYLQDRLIACGGRLGLVLSGTGPLRGGADRIERLELLLDGCLDSSGWERIFQAIPLVGSAIPGQRLVVLESGELVKYFQAPHELLGFAQIAHTGPETFVQALRQREGWDRTPAVSEEDAFRQIGLPWIPPSLRGQTGIIARALAGRLPCHP